jgi:hypothetical protein
MDKYFYLAGTLKPAGIRILFFRLALTLRTIAAMIGLKP